MNRIFKLSLLSAMILASTNGYGYNRPYGTDPNTTGRMQSDQDRISMGQSGIQKSPYDSYNYPYDSGTTGSTTEAYDRDRTYSPTYDTGTTGATGSSVDRSETYRFKDRTVPVDTYPNDQDRISSGQSGVKKNPYRSQQNTDSDNN